MTCPDWTKCFVSSGVHDECTTSTTYCVYCRNWWNAIVEVALYSSSHVTGTWQANRILFTVICNRTKWKRQASVGIEMIVEAGNIAAVQNLYRVGASGPQWLPAMAHPLLAHQIDLYYRSQMATAAFQRPPLPSLPISHTKLLQDPMMESVAATLTSLGKTATAREETTAPESTSSNSWIFTASLYRF